MKFFVVTYVHRNLTGWKEYLEPHLDYLKKLVQQGILRASGPVFGLPTAPSPARAAMLILKGKDKEAVMEVLQTDPFMVHNLVDEMTVSEWDPVFGTYAAESSGSVKG